MCIVSIICRIVAINMNTQAQHHSQLRAGLFVQSIGSTDVSHIPYEQVLGLIKSSKSRPLTIMFVMELPELEPKPEPEPQPELKPELEPEPEPEPEPERRAQAVLWADQWDPLVRWGDAISIYQTGADSAQESDPVQDEQGTRLKLLQLYSDHNPSKLLELDTLIDKYGASDLLRKVRRKYLDEYSARPQAAPTTTRPPGMSLRYCL